MPLKDFWSNIWGKDDPEFVGVMPIRQDIEVLPADDPRGEIDIHDQITISSKNKTGKNTGGRLVLGWTVKEEIGIAVVNTRGVAAGRKSVVVGK